MRELKWKDAIIKVLEEERQAFHYTKIAEIIAEKGYRTSFGATPQNTVSANITTDINKNKEKSIFARVNKGIYILRKIFDDSNNLIIKDFEDTKSKKRKNNIEKTKFINSYGIYWDRKLVHWRSTTPELFRVQKVGATNVNFKNQIGIYLIHDSSETIYIGQAIKQPLGQRLRKHTTDRHGVRWDRFSWFGFYPIKENLELEENLDLSNITINDFGDMLEEILIENIEPRQNRKQGNQFDGIEFLHQEAPEIKKHKKQKLLKELT